MILILSEPGDGTVPFVLDHLERSGAAHLWFDPAAFPADARVTARFTAGLDDLLLCVDGRQHDLSEVTAIWDRRPGLPRASGTVGPDHRRWVELTSRTFVTGLVEVLPGRRLPGRTRDVLIAENKIVHLTRAAELGFVIPETVMTNDPAELVPAWERAGGNLIAKTEYASEFTVDGQDHFLYTTPVHRAHLRGRHRIGTSPVILQPNVPKSLELRVTVVGDRIFAVEIDSQSARSTRQDWRHFEDDRIPYRIHALPPEVADRCLALLRSFGLSFGAIDFILTPQGEYVFLEINPNGQWGWIEQWTGLPIARAIADWLTAPA
ncbi:hypothetical protein HS041_03670 [Planomonospora sp. ID67723]|uniref:MvdC/MvdD family ATP grasp protein n=1 Tax=Planomonospora sp. ID67723 TaxID=2738134 RepID=UPI0018C3923E|nr:ATP-dependent carboxylate-amine ligase [Planomonospora sp. ID67723]MBG0826871.1 hypothetical protein [Planomonospora sp. ID67723]